jgi:hypothetical protein
VFFWVASSNAHSPFFTKRTLHKRASHVEPRLNECATTQQGPQGILGARAFRHAFVAWLLRLFLLVAESRASLCPQKVYTRVTGMRAVCDVCESAPARVFCAADQAAMCAACDDQV